MTSGHLLIATGALHNVVGLLAGTGLVSPAAGVPRQAPLFEILHSGVVGAVEPHPTRMIIFWFLMFGALLILWGLSLHRAERAGSLSRAEGWSLIGLGLVGGLMVPLSGFWLAIPQGWWVLRKTRARTGGPARE